MENYWDGSICKNGHVIDYGKGNDAKHCYQCGALILTQCSHCHAHIRGAKKINAGSLDFYLEPKRMHMEFPNYCYQCGQPYEWTEKILHNAQEIITLDENVDLEVLDIIKDCIPDLLTESPSTSLAITKYQININKFSEPVIEGMTRLLKEFVPEKTKEALFK